MADLADTFTDAADFWISVIPMDDWEDPWNSVYWNALGVVEATNCGGDARELTVTDGTVVGLSTPNTSAYRFLAGKDVYVLIRMKDAGANLEMRLNFENFYQTDWVSIAADTDYRMFILGPIPAMTYSALVSKWDDPAHDFSIQIEPEFRRSVSGAPGGSGWPR